ncbi:hypothetical protein D9757_010603 [Collybiopsis confluens]|uniref:Uncharacterized protein n=1 Tax=Collybiopsis confluens TaxID=2823264 RepID=A0A8H5LW95_9AGAR|nr:hypothetical protein D9757_010603 [Collybiopsis confluens]
MAPDSVCRILIFLMFEGWTYFALALLELLSHFLSAVRDNLQVFKVIDVVLGAISSLPLLFYTIFLCVFTWNRLMDDIPQRLQKLGKFLMVVLIPAAVALNGISSFIGITHRSINASIEVGFGTVQDKTLWTLFTDLDIGFVAAYQLIHFIFAFLRLAKAFLEQGRIESTDADEALLFRGTGWIVIGIMLGVIETAIAFVPPHFGTTLARRILRAVGRGLLIYGLYKGLDVSENFEQVREEIQAGTQNRSFRGSRIRPISSNHFFSPLRQFSPETHPSTTLETISEKDTPPNTPRPSGQRVTVQFDSASGKAPTLQMRFSALDMPSPVEIVESIKTEPDKQGITHSRKSSYYANSVMTRQTEPPLPSPTADLPLRNAAEISPAHIRHNSDFSAQFGGGGVGAARKSEDSWTHSVVKNLASQFPPLPASISTASHEPSPIPIPQTREYLPVVHALTSHVPPTPSHSLPRKPAPHASLVMNTIDPFTDEDAEPGIKLPTVLDSYEHVHQMGLALAPPDDWIVEDQNYIGRPDSRESASIYSTTSLTADKSEDVIKNNLGEWESGGGSRSRSGIAPSELPWLRQDERVSPTNSDSHGRKKSFQSSKFQRPESGEYDVGYTEADPGPGAAERRTRRNTSASGSFSRSSRTSRSRSAPRIKSVGSAPKKRTPSLTHSTYVRDSVYIEPGFIPADEAPGYDGIGSEQGTWNDSVPLRDSGVLGSGRNESPEFHAM